MKRHYLWALHIAAYQLARITCSVLEAGMSGLRSLIGAHMERRTIKEFGSTEHAIRTVLVGTEAAPIYSPPPLWRSDTGDGPN